MNTSQPAPSESLVIRNAKQYKAPFLIAISVCLFLFAIYNEISLSQELAKTQSKQNALNFVQSAQKAITSWKKYHAFPPQNESKALEISQLSLNTKELFSTSFILHRLVDLDKLTVTWKIYVLYFDAYIQFMCADMDKRQSCSDNAVNSIVMIEKQNMENLKKAEVQWLANEGILTHLKLLKAYIYAQQFSMDRQSAKKKQSAIDALNGIGIQSLLIGGQFNDDRILKPIYDLAFPNNDKPGAPGS
jgi:hypothetical protein